MSKVLKRKLFVGDIINILDPYSHIWTSDAIIDDDEEEFLLSEEVKRYSWEVISVKFVKKSCKWDDDGYNYILRATEETKELEKKNKNRFLRDTICIVEDTDLIKSRKYPILYPGINRIFNIT